MTEHVGEGEALCEEFEQIHGCKVTPGPDGKRGTMEYRASVHALAQGQSAVCLSGGGVRSAAFSMGVLQGLARRGLLGQFDYLSTVSGGGYIGCWLTGWLHRVALQSEAEGGTAAAGASDVIRQLNARRPDDGREAEPIRWLRENQRFLNARAGVASGDLWATVALFVRDLLLNWLVYLPTIAACLLLPRLFEFALIYWSALADKAGSSFGWLFATIVYGPLQSLQGEPSDTLTPPQWEGYLDLAGAAVMLVAMQASMRSRTRSQPGRPGANQIDDRSFRRRILLPLLVASWLLVMFNAAILVHDVEPDGGLRLQWCIGMPLVYVAARALAARGALHRRATDLPSLRLELVYLTVAGATAGLVVWAGMELRFLTVGSYATVHDFVVFGVPWVLIAVVAGQIVYAGLSSTAPFGRRDQEWLARASGHYLLAAAAWTVLFGLIIYGHPLQGRFWSMIAVSGVAGVLSVGTAVSTLTKARETLASMRLFVGSAVLLQIGLLVFLCGAVVGLQTVTEGAIAHVTGVALNQFGNGLCLKLHAIEHLSALQPADQEPPYIEAVREGIRKDAALAFFVALGSSLALLAASAIASRIVDVNLFSLHGLYRNRLVRTFLGASNFADRRRDKFDGFAAGDDLPLADIWRDQAGNMRREGPFPVLNMALNLVGERDLAVQDRKAGPFTATPLRYGSERVGYVRHDVRQHRRNLSLGTAMAISGAAASPNWGYHSSPLMSFVLMLFNLRLGWWMQNPKRPDTPPDKGESSRLFIQEVLGRTSDHDPYVYLSDGGHFDNLGVYEMFRRRCSLIVAVDGSQDADYTLEDLGRALREASVDFGVSVEFGPILLKKRADPAAAGVYAALGTITYAEQGKAAQPGHFIYIKPGLLADAPADVRAYGAANARFPHDPTFNQFFTEPQFESYRALGEHAVGRICGAASSIELADLPALVDIYIEEHLSAEERPPALSKQRGEQCVEPHPALSGHH